MRPVSVCGKLGLVSGGLLISVACAVGGQEGEDFQDTGAPPMAGTDTTTDGGTGTGGTSTVGGLDGDDCAGALQSTAGTTLVDTAQMSDDYGSYTCGGDSFSATGGDAVLAIDVPAGHHLVAVQDAAHNGMIAGYSTCDPSVASACVGFDDAPVGGLDGFIHHNDRGQTESIYVFSDGASASGAVDVHLNTYDPATHGDSCATAVSISKVAASAAGGTTVAHGLDGYSNQLGFAADVCVGSAADGAEVVFSVVLDSDESLFAAVRPVGAGSNVALYLVVGDCSDLDAQCAAGADAAPGGGEESVGGYSPPADGTTVFIVVDGAAAGSAAGAFLLDVQIQ